MVSLICDEDMFLDDIYAPTKILQVISATGLGDFTVGNVIDIAWVLNFYFPAVLLLCYIISEYSAHLSLSGEPR